MAQMNLEKILKNRSKRMLDFFFRTKCLSVLIMATLLVIAGVICYISYNPEDTLPHLIVGGATILIFLLLLLSILRLFNNNLTREEVDAVIAHDRQIAFDGLFQNLSIENIKSRYQVEPLELVCPEVYPGRKTICYRYFKKDSKVYYSQVGYTWLFFGEKSLYYYHASVNHVYGFIGYEVSTEFDYKDIVTVQTSVKHYHGVERFMLTLTLVNGESVNIALRTRPNFFYGSTHSLSEKEASVLSTIRQVIRKSK